MSKAIPYDQLHVGDKLGPFDVDVSEDDVRQYIGDWADGSSVYLDGSVVEGVMIPPAYMAGLLCVRLLSTKFHTKATLITKTSHENLRPVRAGQTIRSMGEIVDKYIKRGIEYVVISCVTYDADGEPFRKSTDHIALELARRPQAEEAAK